MPAKRNKIPNGNAGTPVCPDATASGSNTGAQDPDAAGSSVAGKGACVPTEDTGAKRNKIPSGNAGTPACTDATAARSNLEGHDRDAAGSNVAGKGACVPTEERVLGACAAAADELKASRVLIGALERENAALKTRVDTEKAETRIMSELTKTRKSEADALRGAIAAKNETIAANETVIGAQDKLIGTLKHKKSSPWRRLGDVLIGAAVFAILK